MLPFYSMRTFNVMKWGSLAVLGSALLFGCADPPEETMVGDKPVVLPNLVTSFEGNFAVSSASVGTDGDFLIGGTFRGTIDFGAGAHESDASYNKIFVAHLDANGTHLFSGSTGANDQLRAVSLDPDGNIYMAGWVDGNISFGEGPLTGNADGFFASFGQGGVPKRSFLAGGIASDTFYDIAVLPNENVVLAGYFGDDADLGGGASAAYKTSEQSIVSFDKEGNYLWEIRYGASAVDGTTAVAADDEGNIFAVSSSYVPFMLGGQSLQSGAQVVKFDPEGKVLWAQSVTTQMTGFPIVSDVTVDENGNAYFIGFYNGGPIKFGPFGAPYTDAQNGFLAGVSKDGTPLFLRAIERNWYNNSKPSLAPRKGGGVLLGLTAYGEVNFGSGLFGTPDSFNVAIASIDDTGEVLDAIELDGSGNEVLGALGTAPDGTPVVIGTFSSILDVGEDRLIATYTNDMFVVRYPLLAK